MILSFSGGSWIGICYYLGIISALIDRDPQISNDLITLGASAGAWVAVALQFIDHINLNTVRRLFYEYMDRLPKIPRGCEADLSNLFDEIFAKVTDEQVKIVGHRIHLSVTHWTGWRYCNELRTGFQTLQDIRHAVIHSSRIPGMIGNDITCVDGGLTNNQPSLGAETIKICSIWGLGGDIHPSGWTNPIYYLIPPHLEIREKLYIKGIESIQSWFTSKETS